MGKTLKSGTTIVGHYNRSPKSYANWHKKNTKFARRGGKSTEPGCRLPMDFRVQKRKMSPAAEITTFALCFGNQLSSYSVC